MIKRFRPWMYVLVVILGMIGVSHALSPFQTVAGVGGPMPGVSMSCTNVNLSSTTATQILAANSLREALYVVNSSSVPISTGARDPIVYVSTWAVVATNITDYSSLSAVGFPLWSMDNRAVPSSATIQGVSSLIMNGGSTWQGPVFGLTDGNGGRAQACELNP